MLKANSIRAHGIIPAVLALSLGDVALEDVALEDVALQDIAVEDAALEDVALQQTALREIAADHVDAPRAALAVPSSNILDLYAWTSNDTSKLNLALTVSPDAGPESWFSSELAYAFSVASSPAIGEPQEVTRIVCKFADTASLECWFGSDYLLGDPRDPGGLTSDAGYLRVFAGLRNDPFFLEPAGFDAVLATLREGIEDESLDFPEDDGGCPSLTEDRAEQLRALMASGEGGAAPSDSFAGQNVLALVVQVDRAQVDVNGPILGVWAAAYAALEQ